MTLPKINCDGRSIIGIASYGLVLLVLLMIWTDKTLLNNEFFKFLATALVTTGWLGGAVAWAYSSTKNGGELSAKMADIAAGTNNEGK